MGLMMGLARVSYGGQKMSVFVHAQDIKTVHAGERGGGAQKWQNSVHVVVGMPPYLSSTMK